MIIVAYLDEGETLLTVDDDRVRRGHTRREALAAHQDVQGTGLEYARNPAGGCRMVAYDEEKERSSEHGQGAKGVWGPWTPGPPGNKVPMGER